MEITKLVILFNKDKILLGITVAIIGFIASVFVFPLFSFFLMTLSVLIIINILLSLFASYKLYDKSDLYQPEKLFSNFNFNKSDKAIFLHASFDPISRKLEKMFGPNNLKIYNLYGSRHEDEKSIEVSNRLFPPHPDQQNVNPTNLNDESDSIDYIFAITSAHEILSQEKRIKFFKESKRVLKENGTLILCEQMRDITNFIFFNIGTFHFVSLKNWESAITEAGMRIVKKDKLTIWGTVLHIEK